MTEVKPLRTLGRVFQHHDPSRPYGARGHRTGRSGYRKLTVKSPHDSGLLIELTTDQ
jgi:hypothetical protein